MIKVTLIKPTSRRFFLAQWDDPITGLTKTKSTRETVRRLAERVAARIEDQLNAGEQVATTAITWEAFQSRYLAEVSDTKRIKTKLKTKATMAAITAKLAPAKLASIADPNVISSFASKLRIGRKPSTVDGHLREVRKMLRWAHKMSLIRRLPHIEFPSITKSMKGRPLTDDECRKASLAVADVVLPEFAEEWRKLMDGLPLSGLRLGESMSFHWTDDTLLCVDLSHRHPMFRIQGDGEKSGECRLLPMAPDFARWLLAIPEDQRTGYVFNPYTNHRGGRKGCHRPTANHVGRVISRAMKKAGVKTSLGFGSAQDFRRTFGYRWCKIVMPNVLQEMMRHESIQTTMKYYVGQMAEEAADILWDADTKRTGNTSGNTPENFPIKPDKTP